VHAYLGRQSLAVDVVADLARQIEVFEPVDACLGGHKTWNGAGWW
jgi:hypothetical protein